LIRALQVPNSPAHTALVEAIKGTKAFAGLEPAAVAACIAEAVDGLSVDARFRDDEYYGSTMMLALSPPHPRELHLGPKLDLAKLTPSGDLEATSRSDTKLLFLTDEAPPNKLMMTTGVTFMIKPVGSSQAKSIAFLCTDAVIAIPKGSSPEPEAAAAPVAKLSPQRRALLQQMKESVLPACS